MPFTFAISVQPMYSEQGPLYFCYTLHCTVLCCSSTSLSFYASRPTEPSATLPKLHSSPSPVFLSYLLCILVVPVEALVILLELLSCSSTTSSLSHLCTARPPLLLNHLIQSHLTALSWSLTGLLSREHL